MIYVLAILFVILLIYIIKTVINKERSIGKEINSILESRLKYTEREYQRNQEQLLDLKLKVWLNDSGGICAHTDERFRSSCYRQPPGPAGRIEAIEENQFLTLAQLNHFPVEAAVASPFRLQPWQTQVPALYRV